MTPSPIALPGQPLSPTTTTDIGPGTHIDHSTNTIHASISGQIHTHKPANPKSLPTTSISRTSTTAGQNPPLLLPTTGSTILGRITRLSKTQANLLILSTSSTPSPYADPFPAIIRQQDIRLTEIAKVTVASAFRVGDIVRATVISLGDERSYYCSTARNDLGVVMATSEWGNQMFPVSWREFQDSVTGAREERKVAKPV
ncbi:Exosome complex component csl4 [Lecanosticta acicola]|uniref:Exosome complex component csl4 n=1 Tax=Lecanosticta acicola TaxID=111012 RepID=A0AAI8YY63_9PEZI|nr:Exosome complex component csl4 [Lecanosticta acicola]